MSQADVELVRKWLPPDGSDLVDVFAPGPPDELTTLSEDVVVRFIASDAEMEGGGAEGFQSTWSDWLEAWQSYRVFTEDVIDQGSRVVCLVRLEGVTKQSKVSIVHRPAAVFTVEDGRVMTADFYLDRNELGY